MMRKETLYKIHQLVLFIIYIALIVFFIIKCLETGDESTKTSQVVVDSTATVINTIHGEGSVDPKDPSFINFVRKFIGHYSYFVVLGGISILFYLSLRDRFKEYLLIIIHYGIGIGFAILSEFLLEGKTMGRGASWADVGIDSLGFITLSIVIIGIYYLIKQKKKNKINMMNE